MKRHIYLLSAAAVFLSGCAVTPPTIVHQPTTLPPQSAKPQREMNGAIFQTASYRPLYEDVKARLIGDVLTINLSEKTSAGKTSASSASKSGSIAYATPTVFGLPTKTTGQGGLSITGANKFGEAGAESSGNNFSGTITVTVIEVLPNGNLVVSGEKQMAFDKASEFVRFSGVVNPQTIAAGNQVSSTQVADARLEYRSTSHVDKAEANSMLTRFFLSFLPL